MLGKREHKAVHKGKPVGTIYCSQYTIVGEVGEGAEWHNSVAQWLLVVSTMCTHCVISVVGVMREKSFYYRIGYSNIEWPLASASVGIGTQHLVQPNISDTKRTRESDGENRERIRSLEGWAMAANTACCRKSLGLSYAVGTFELHHYVHIQTVKFK